MKQCKILYEKCKKKLPNRPPDEIDFGLGFRAGLGWLQETLESEVTLAVVKAKIYRELK